MPRDIKDWIIRGAPRVRPSDTLDPEDSQVASAVSVESPNAHTTIEHANAVCAVNSVRDVSDDDEAYDEGFVYIKNVYGNFIKVPAGYGGQHRVYSAEEVIAGDSLD